MARLRKDTQALALLGFHKVGVPPPGSWETWYNVPEEVTVHGLVLPVAADRPTSAA